MSLCAYEGRIPLWTNINESIKTCMIFNSSLPDMNWRNSVLVPYNANEDSYVT